jgi:hypothetical protein
MAIVVIFKKPIRGAGKEPQQNTDLYFKSVKNILNLNEKYQYQKKVPVIHLKKKEYTNKVFEEIKWMKLMHDSIKSHQSALSDNKKIKAILNNPPIFYEDGEQTLQNLYKWFPNLIKYAK